MARGTPSEAEVASTLSHLAISSTHPKKPAAKPKSAPVADSWDADLSGSDTEKEDDGAPGSARDSDASSLSPISLSTVPSADLPNPPPPTPASPVPFEFPDNVPYGAAPALGGAREARRGSAAGGAGLERRPEKTTAVAGRLIAGALGVRAPKRSEEEREFDRVMREKERKRREEERGREKREREAAEERKRSVWED